MNVHITWSIQSPDGKFDERCLLSLGLLFCQLLGTALILANSIKNNYFLKMSMQKINVI